MSTHKIITSFLKGADKNFFITKTCRPNPNALDIYRKLNFSSMPVKTKKYVVPH